LFRSVYIKIKNSSIADPNTRNLIEFDLRKAIEQIKPAHSEIFRVEWVD
jgi:hypothetical protein